MLKLIFVICLAVRFDNCKSSVPSLVSKLNKVVFAYPSGAQVEKELHICPENSACNIIHKRFWLPQLIERLCRCPNWQECPWTWSDKPDNYTTMLDNRSQIKFCSELSELSSCASNEPAIRVKTKSYDETETVKKKIAPKFTTEQRNVTKFCRCQEPHYWNLMENMTISDEETVSEFYACSDLTKCNSMEFCGNVRTDTFSTFYRCSCPLGHLCISTDKTIQKTKELLFTGHAYQAVCFPSPSKSKSNNKKN